MGLFLTSFLVIVLAGLGMALGVLFGRRPLAGSCGGLNVVAGARCPLCRDSAGARQGCRRPAAACGKVAP
jgi:hypothetical protein